MAPRPFWKGYLRLSLVLCPIQLFPATSEREKVRFHQINKKTGHRIKYCKLGAQTGEQVDPEDIVMGYEIAKGQYIEVTEDELERPPAKVIDLMEALRQSAAVGRDAARRQHVPHPQPELPGARPRGRTARHRTSERRPPPAIRSPRAAPRQTEGTCPFSTDGLPAINVSSMPCRCAAASSIAVCLYRAARDSAASTAQR